MSSHGTGTGRALIAHVAAAVGRPDYRAIQAGEQAPPSGAKAAATPVYARGPFSTRSQAARRMNRYCQCQTGAVTRPMRPYRPNSRW